jgi:hypothetical protein
VAIGHQACNPNTAWPFSWRRWEPVCNTVLAPPPLPGANTACTTVGSTPRSQYTAADGTRLGARRIFPCCCDTPLLPQRPTQEVAAAPCQCCLWCQSKSRTHHHRQVKGHTTVSYGMELPWTICHATAKIAKRCCHPLPPSQLLDAMGAALSQSFTPKPPRPVLASTPASASASAHAAAADSASHLRLHLPLQLHLLSAGLSHTHPLHWPSSGHVHASHGAQPPTHTCKHTGPAAAAVWVCYTRKRCSMVQQPPVAQGSVTTPT